MLMIWEYKRESISLFFFFSFPLLYAASMNDLYVKAFRSYIQPVVRLIRNRDTAVIVQLNNSLSPSLSKNVPMIPSPFTFRLHLYLLLFFLSPPKNKLPSAVPRKLRKLLLFASISLKDLKFEKKKKTSW